MSLHSVFSQTSIRKPVRVLKIFFPRHQTKTIFWFFRWFHFLWQCVKLFVDRHFSANNLPKIWGHFYINELFVWLFSATSTFTLFVCDYSKRPTRTRILLFSASYPSLSSKSFQILLPFSFFFVFGNDFLSLLLLFITFTFLKV